MVNRYIFDSDSGEEIEEINNANSPYEIKNKPWTSEDGRKTFTMDKFGRIEVSISDEFGNEIISKRDRKSVV